MSPVCTFKTPREKLPVVDVQRDFSESWEIEMLYPNVRIDVNEARSMKGVMVSGMAVRELTG